LSVEFDLIERTKRFAKEVNELIFSGDMYVYNPLEYAWDAHKLYLERYVHPGVKVMFLGMNPGPFGMAQTGVPFGEIDAVRSWMDIETEVGQPHRFHPKRPVTGFKTTRHEVSGQRLWSLMAERYGSAKVFFSSHTVMNYCPLVFVDSGPTGRNIVPQKLPKQERALLESVCDRYLSDVIRYLHPQFLVGIGSYASDKLRQVVTSSEKDMVITILHPSPGNPQANSGWAKKVVRQLQEASIW
jgi:single-strand selective monofunctional uracil DNA glycosylase